MPVVVPFPSGQDPLVNGAVKALEYPLMLMKTRVTWKDLELQGFSCPKELRDLVAMSVVSHFISKGWGVKYDTTPDTFYESVDASFAFTYVPGQTQDIPLTEELDHALTLASSRISRMVSHVSEFEFSDLGIFDHFARRFEYEIRKAYEPAGYSVTYKSGETIRSGPGLIIKKIR